jgi:hypothetical protein
VSEAAELFARLTGELEDMHGLAVEGQVASQPPELLRVLADALATGLRRAARTLLEARVTIDADG